MPEPREYRTEAIVIKKTKLGEADSIITFFTPHLGRIQGFARSLRRPRNKLAGHLELLTHSLVSFARGRNIDTITSAQTINAFLPLKEDLWLSSCGLYATELVYQFTPERQENPALFHLLLATLEHLCRENRQENLLRYFEVHLLESTGYRPELRECVVCHQTLQHAVNHFSPAAGGTVCPQCRQSQGFTLALSVNAQKVLRFYQDGDFTAASGLKTDPVLDRELENVLNIYIKYLLEKEVKSAAWLEKLREQQATLRR